MKKVVWITLALALGAGCKQKAAPPLQQKTPAATTPKKEVTQPAAKKAEPADRHAGRVLPAELKTKRDPKEIISSAVKRRGGLELLRSIKSARATHEVEGMPGDENTRRVTLQFPDKLLLEIYSKGKVIRATVMDGDRGHVMVSNSESTPLDAITMSDLRRTVSCDPLRALVAASEPGAKLTYKGETRVGPRLVDQVEVMVRDNAVNLFVARDDGELLAYRHASRSGPMTVVHSDFKEIGGTRMAHTNTISVSGARVVSRVKALELNPKLPDGAFNPRKYRFK